jgi:hypothetical protein
MECVRDAAHEAGRVEYGALWLPAGSVDTDHRRAVDDDFIEGALRFRFDELATAHFSLCFGTPEGIELFAREVRLAFAPPQHIKE